MAKQSPANPPILRRRRRQQQTDLAQRVRKIYIFERRRWEAMLGESKNRDYLPGRHCDGHPKRKAIWPALADFFVREELPVHGYARFVFEHHGYIVKPPVPNHLTSVDRLSEYREYEEQESRDLLIALKFQAEEFCRQIFSYTRMSELSDETWTDAQMLSGVLLNVNNQLSALFRYCAAIRIGDQHIAELFETEASVQYAVHAKGYDETWDPDMLQAAKPMLQQRYESYLANIPDY